MTVNPRTLPLNDPPNQTLVCSALGVAAGECRRPIRSIKLENEDWEQNSEISQPMEWSLTSRPEPMRILSSNELLEIWERGTRLPPIDKAILLLAAACYLLAWLILPGGRQQLGRFISLPLSLLRVSATEAKP